MQNRVLVLILLAFYMLGCAAGGPAKKPDNKPNGTGQAEESATGSKQKTEQGFSWDKDPRFITAKQKAGTPLLLASYRATLPDPILGERHNIALAALYLSGAVVNPGDIFSLNARVGWRSAERGFKPGPMYSGGRIVATVGGGVCKIASVIYNVAILADQEIVERHPHSMTVPYVPPGQDATISFGTKDFKFRNTSGAPILIWAQNTGGTLDMAFYGKVKPPQVRWMHKTLSRTDTRTEFLNDPSLPEGAEKVVYEGAPGVTVHSWVTVTKGKEEFTKDLGISAYNPMPRVVARGTQPSLAQIVGRNAK